jgi:hypothetical protein
MDSTFSISPVPTGPFTPNSSLQNFSPVTARPVRSDRTHEPHNAAFVHVSFEGSKRAPFEVCAVYDDRVLLKTLAVLCCWTSSSRRFEGALY